MSDDLETEIMYKISAFLMPKYLNAESAAEQNIFRIVMMMNQFFHFFMLG